MTQFIWSDIVRAAESLGLDPCAVQAVVDVESNGNGFLPDGRPKILFEGHVFWKEVQKRGINPEYLALPNIAYPRWDKSQYKGGAAEWNRLQSAVEVNRDAALSSASWGLFQIMGFNHKACGFDSVEEFVEAQQESEERQLESFCTYLRSQGLILFLLALDWAGFARRYNGPEYKQNRYDEKLRQAYERCKREDK